MNIDVEIDCYVKCPMILRSFNSCPSITVFKSNSIFDIDPEKLNPRVLEEIIYIVFSTFPYLLSFYFLINAVLFKTSRGVLILLLCCLENFVIEVLKNALRDPRPNYKCNQQFGNPSNHAVFFSALVTWTICEKFFLETEYQLKNNLAKITLYICFPLILLSRYKLKYHNIEQIFNGCCVGVVLTILWFMIISNLILENETRFTIFLSKFGIENNMSSNAFLPIIDSMTNPAYAKYVELTRKHDELTKMKKDLKSFKDSMKNLDILNKNSPEFPESFDDILKNVPQANQQQEEFNDENPIKNGNKLKYD